MDKRYKAPLFAAFRAVMAAELPQFIFSRKGFEPELAHSPSNLSFRWQPDAQWNVFIVLEPGEGSRAEFSTYLGWCRVGESCRYEWGPERMWVVNSNPFPSSNLPSALLDFQELERQPAIAPVVIPSPRDELALPEFARLSKAAQTQRSREIAMLDSRLSADEIARASEAGAREVVLRIRRVLPEVAKALTSL